MLISETFPASGILKNPAIKPLYRCIMAAVALLFLVIGFVPAGAPAATTALASIANFAPCGDTPGFCPIALAKLGEQS